MILSQNLRMFLLAARHLSFTVAAREAYVSQPAVTVRIKKLEEYLGFELFTRMPSGLRLTPAGSVFYEYAQRLELLASEAQRTAKDVAEGDEAHLYLGANRSATSYMLPRLLIAFHEANPKVRIRTEVHASDRLLERLTAGYLDAVIVEQSVDESRYHVMPLLKDEVVVICNRDHPLAKRRSRTVTLDELCELPLVTHEPNSGTRQLLSERLAVEGRNDSDLNIVMELQSSELVKLMVSRGQGAGLVSRLSLSNGRYGEELVVLSIEGDPLYRFFNLVTTEKGLGRAKVRDLCRIAGETYREDMLFEETG
ncbi:LysR family transcriptional regulator [Inmirania thermothiophila]|uniref:DNA-binding transcriptional LysR family regulator n=1 Tax=Inmirania thermothiophila TaxID=1750597 RepID=A0A3N1XZF4_9GAMM|nr:LysR family transcriptional regulator [Inmirania thermothiophila]ROR31975.1 DNA-binding transcriptional LysR family regulator [Inmirania thermothiophila]